MRAPTFENTFTLEDAWLTGYLQAAAECAEAEEEVRSAIRDAAHANGFWAGMIVMGACLAIIAGIVIAVAWRL